MAATPRAAWANHNVILGLITSFSSGLADSIWTGTVYAGYLYALCSTSASPNTMVGMAEAAIGVSTLIFALPVGWLADTFPRHRVIIGGAVAMLVAVALTCYAVLSGDDTAGARHYQFKLLMAASALWGLCNGMTNGPVQALIADSLPTGSRSQYYTWLYTSYFLPSCVGPLVCIALFQKLGAVPGAHGADDSGHWSVAELRPVLLVGVLLELPCALTMFFYSSDKALGEVESGQRVDLVAAEAGEGSGGGSGGGEGEGEGDGTEEGDTPKFTGLTFCGLGQGSIPYIKFAADLVTAVASGMTVKFFPLFFKSTVGLSPSAVQGIYVAVPLSMVAAATVSQRLSGVIGRVQVMLLTRTIGVGCLFLMVCLKQYQSEWRIMIPIYILRTAANNCCFPLEESIQMDFVDKSTRARWKSLEAVMQFGWCGSAVLGGLLSDRSGGDYSFTFLITALLQALGGAFLLPLLGLVPSSEELAPTGGQADAAAAGDAGTGYMSPTASGYFTPDGSMSGGVSPRPSGDGDTYYAAIGDGGMDTPRPSAARRDSWADMEGESEGAEGEGAGGEGAEGEGAEGEGAGGGDELREPLLPSRT